MITKRIDAINPHSMDEFDKKFLNELLESFIRILVQQKQEDRIICSLCHKRKLSNNTGKSGWSIGRKSIWTRYIKHFLNECIAYKPETIIHDENLSEFLRKYPREKIKNFAIRNGVKFSGNSEVGTKIPGQRKLILRNRLRQYISHTKDNIVKNRLGPYNLETTTTTALHDILLQEVMAKHPDWRYAFKVFLVSLSFDDYLKLPCSSNRSKTITLKTAKAFEVKAAKEFKKIKNKFATTITLDAWESVQKTKIIGSIISCGNNVRFYQGIAYDEPNNKGSTNRKFIRKLLKRNRKEILGIVYQTPSSNENQSRRILLNSEKAIAVYDINCMVTDNGSNVKMARQGIAVEEPGMNVEFCWSHQYNLISKFVFKLECFSNNFRSDLQKISQHLFNHIQKRYLIKMHVQATY